MCTLEDHGNCVEAAVEQILEKNRQQLTGADYPLTHDKFPNYLPEKREQKRNLNPEQHFSRISNLFFFSSSSSQRCSDVAAGRHRQPHLRRRRRRRRHLRRGGPRRRAAATARRAGPEEGEDDDGAEEQGEAGTDQGEEVPLGW